MNYRVAKAYAEMKKAKYNPDGTPKENAKASAKDTTETPKTIDHLVPKPFGSIVDPWFRRCFR